MVCQNFNKTNQELNVTQLTQIEFFRCIGLAHPDQIFHKLAPLNKQIIMFIN